eukprot:3110196-Prymnesium_polylepis.2
MKSSGVWHPGAGIAAGRRSACCRRNTPPHHDERSAGRRRHAARGFRPAHWPGGAKGSSVCVFGVSLAPSSDSFMPLSLCRH